MPARIRIVEGAGAGSTFWIEHEVLRVGRSADCDLRLDGQGVPDHAVTVCYRDGGYFMANRSGQVVELNGQPVLPAESRPWSDSQHLAVGSGTVLQLEMGADPAPARPPSLPGAGGDEDSFESQSERARNHARRVRLAVLIALCVVASAALFFSGNPSHRSARQTTSVSAEFDAITRRLLWESEEDSLAIRELCWMLQEGRRGELRGDRQYALQAYGAVRDLLIGQGDGGLPVSGQLYQRLLRFVKSRLEALSI